MPTFSVDIEKHRNGHEEVPWTNVYHVESTDLDAAVVDGTAILGTEKKFHSTSVNFTSMRVSTITPDDGIFVSIPISGSGLFDETGDLLPAFLALRVDFVPDFGFKGRKFYHVIMGEEQQANGLWGTDLLNEVADAWSDYFAAYTSSTTPLVNPSGTQQYISALAWIPVTQHQFRRGSKRRIPIL